MIPDVAQSEKQHISISAARLDERLHDFVLPKALEAGQPPEARGLPRDQVRLMVTYTGTDCIIHTRFDRLPDFLVAGDVLVINTSGTLNAALKAWRSDGAALEVHLSTHLPNDLWSIELRQPVNGTTEPFYGGRENEILCLPAGGRLALLRPYSSFQSFRRGKESPGPLWLARLQLPLGVQSYLSQYGFPIRYHYVQESWPNSYYQTAYVTEMGSAEMPSAGRAFTPELITRLVSSGIQLAPLLLHTGVASLENDDPPYEEYYRVPETTASLVNNAVRDGRRVIAVGTTSIRALETVTESRGQTHAGEGWTNLIITPERGVKVFQGILTGFHEPRSTHMAMLSALAPVDHLEKAYTEAINREYLWHEFGDLHLILP
jgi:S-adenosylmethionine:tRNA ribosyltransferase-isomerase